MISGLSWFSFRSSQWSKSWWPSSILSLCRCKFSSFLPNHRQNVNCAGSSSLTISNINHSFGIINKLSYSRFPGWDVPSKNWRSSVFYAQLVQYNPCQCSQADTSPHSVITYATTSQLEYTKAGPTLHFSYRNESTLQFWRQKRRGHHSGGNGAM